MSVESEVLSNLHRPPRELSLTKVLSVYYPEFSFGLIRDPLADITDIITQLEPKIVIPMHHGIAGLKFALDPVDKFLSAMGKEKVNAQNKLSVSTEKLPEELDIVLLEKQ